jgi:hypothetical protein
MVEGFYVVVGAEAMLLRCRCQLLRSLPLVRVRRLVYWGLCVFIMHSLPFKSLLTCMGISTYESFGNSAPKVEFSPPPNQRGRKFYLTAQIC